MMDYLGNKTTFTVQRGKNGRKISNKRRFIK